jgi:hypothetical protein
MPTHDRRDRAPTHRADAALRDHAPTGGARPLQRKDEGGLPAVGSLGGEAGPRAPSPSEMAYGPPGAPALQLKEDGEDKNVVELKTKVSALVTERFGGDYKKAFDHYDADKDGGVGRDELMQLLRDAGVGSGLTRGIWASRIIEKLDQAADAKIQWNEFESGLQG